MGIEAYRGIESLYGVQDTFPTQKSKPSGGGADFGDFLSDAIKQADTTQKAADDKLADLASGQEMDVHGTMIALEEADISMRFMVSVRDKVVDAYQQIMNMNI